MESKIKSVTSLISRVIADGQQDKSVTCLISPRERTNQCTRFRYLSHQRAVKAEASLCIYKLARAFATRIYKL